MPQQTRYRIVEATDLRTKIKSYKIYESGDFRAITAPVAVGFSTREEAEAKLREMEEGGAK